MVVLKLAKDLSNAFIISFCWEESLSREDSQVPAGGWPGGAQSGETPRPISCEAGLGCRGRTCSRRRIADTGSETAGDGEGGAGSAEPEWGGGGQGHWCPASGCVTGGFAGKARAVCLYCAKRNDV